MPPTSKNERLSLGNDTTTIYDGTLLLRFVLSPVDLSNLSLTTLFLMITIDFIPTSKEHAS